MRLSCHLHQIHIAQWIEFLIWRYHTGSFHLKILTFTERREALVSCLWLLKDCTMLNGQTTWTAPCLDYASVYQKYNSARQRRRHLKPRLNRTHKTYTGECVYVTDYVCEKGTTSSASPLHGHLHRLGKIHLWRHERQSITWVHQCIHIIKHRCTQKKNRNKPHIDPCGPIICTWWREREKN